MYPNGTLVDSENLNGTTNVDFDSFGDILIPASSTQPFYVTIDIVDDTTNSGNIISAAFQNPTGTTTPAIECEDDDNDPIGAFL